MDYNVRIENICVNRSLVSLSSLSVSLVRQSSSALSSFSIWRLLAGQLHLARCIVAHRGAPPGHTHCAAFLPAGSYTVTVAAPSPLAAGRRRKVRT